MFFKHYVTCSSDVCHCIKIAHTAHMCPSDPGRLRTAIECYRQIEKWLPHDSHQCKKKMFVFQNLRVKENFLLRKKREGYHWFDRSMNKTR